MFNLFKKKEKAKVKGKEEVKELGLFNEVNTIDIFTIRIRLEGYERKSLGTLLYVMERRRSEQTGCNYYTVYFKINSNVNFIWKSKFSNSLTESDRKFIDKFFEEWVAYKNSDLDCITLKIETKSSDEISNDPIYIKNYIKYEDGHVIEMSPYNVTDSIRLLDEQVYNQQQNRNY